MIEFSSGIGRTNYATKIIATLAIFAAATVGVLLFARYQKSFKSEQSAGPVVVPGMLRPGDSNFEYYKNKIRLENVKAGAFLRNMSHSKQGAAFIARSRRLKWSPKTCGTLKASRRDSKSES